MGIKQLFWLLIFVFTANCQFPKIFWTYWETGTNSHIMQKVLHQNHLKKIEHDGWKVRYLNKTSVLQYLSKIPYFSMQQYARIESQFPLAKKSDYYRCMLVSYYGGVYLDMSSIMYEDFAWLKFENLRNNADVINKHGEEPDVLLFTNYFYGSKETYFDSSLNQTFRVSPGYEIWFLAAKPQSAFLMQYCPMMTKSYLDGSFTQQGYKNSVLKTIQEQEMEVGTIKMSPYLVSLSILQIQMQRKQRQLDMISKTGNSSRQLAVWHYKIWHISAESGPFSIYFYLGDDYINTLAIYSVEQVKQIFNIGKVRYFLKMTNQFRAVLLNYLVTQIPFYSIYHKFKCFYLAPIFCTIYNNSLLYQYLVKQSSYQDRFHIVNANLQNRSSPRIFQTFRFQFTILLLLIIVVGLSIFLFLISRKLRVQNTPKQISIELSTNQNQN